MAQNARKRRVCQCSCSSIRIRESFNEQTKIASNNVKIHLTFPARVILSKSKRYTKNRL